LEDAILHEQKTSFDTQDLFVPYEVEEDSINFKEQRPQVLEQREVPQPNRFTLETLSHIFKHLACTRTWIDE